MYLLLTSILTSIMYIFFGLCLFFYSSSPGYDICLILWSILCNIISRFLGFRALFCCSICQFVILVCIGLGLSVSSLSNIQCKGRFIDCRFYKEGRLANISLNWKDSIHQNIQHIHLAFSPYIGYQQNFQPHTTQTSPDSLENNRYIFRLGYQNFYKEDELANID